jgi:hypothetical protein
MFQSNQLNYRIYKFLVKTFISSTNKLLQAGILHSEALVVVSPEHVLEAEEESFYDSTNIFAIHNIHRSAFYFIKTLIKLYNIFFKAFSAG